uniref:Uncharacterized protein n=1 Tax=Aegilops tauschii TaxID=37682 RepID=M8BQI7_AEGTA
MTGHLTTSSTTVYGEDRRSGRSGSARMACAGSFDCMMHETWIPKDCSSAFSVNGWNTE